MCRNLHRDANARTCRKGLDRVRRSIDDNGCVQLSRYVAKRYVCIATKSFPPPPHNGRAMISQDAKDKHTNEGR